MLLCCGKLQASKTADAFKALSIFDYFKARQLFYKDLEKNSSYAAYGLATIYSRTDNPFHQYDSAAKYVHLSFNAFRLIHQPKAFSGFTVDSSSILRLADSIAFRSFEKLKKNSSIESLEKFLEQNYLATAVLANQAVYLRDELEFNQVLSANSSTVTLAFITTHPQSSFFWEALLLLDREHFDEQTKGHTANEYISFIGKYPNSALLNNAYESLYAIYRQSSDVSGLTFFVNHYPKAPPVTEAWKLLFALTVKSFSNDELAKFLAEHPSFPFKNSILRELELNKIVLYPYRNEDLSGYIDSSGKVTIAPVYDAITNFHEGLAVVNRNDSVFYINKENQNPFNAYYEEAYPFEKGIAVVKSGNKWRFINRQGQALQFYDEINESSNNAYVVKLNGKSGAVDEYGETIIEPRFNVLGDFKNNYAYYIDQAENGKYGFVSKSGFAYKAEFDWISDFDDNSIAVFMQSNLYGLVNTQGTKILPATYDQIVKAPGNLFIVVKNNQYGFFNSEGCYLSPVAFDFMKEKPAAFYTNGNILKLVKKGAQGLMDFNGRMSIDFGTFDEINFAVNGLVKVKRNGKYGFLDRKLSTVIPYKYNEASDFSDSIAVVRLKDKTILINTSGKEIFTSGGSIQKLSPRYYLVMENGQRDIINNTGEKLFINIKATQKYGTDPLIVTLNNNEIKLLRD